MAAQPPAAPTPDYNNTPTCKSHALFLHSFSPGLLILAPIFFTILSVTLTQCIRLITPGVRKNPFPPLATTTPASTTPTAGTGDVEATAVPSPAPAPVAASPAANVTTRHQASSPPVKRALIQYDYAKAENNEIDLVDGEYVLDIEMVTEDWWMGTNLKGERGLFPSNYVEVETLAPADTEVHGEAGEAPPPYAPPSSHPPSPPAPTPAPALALGTTNPSTTATATATPAVEEPQKPKLKRSSAAFFVLGTTLFLPLLFSIFCLALSIQAFSFCGPWSPTRTTAQVFSWLFFCIPAIFASCGMSCYAILVRDLWGKKAREKYKIDEGTVAGSVIFVTSGAILVILGVAVLPFMLLFKLAVKAVESTQRAWCGDALVDEEEGGVEIGELRRAEEVEAEATMAGVVVEGNGEGSEAHVESEEHGESVGLIQGMEK